MSTIAISLTALIIYCVGFITLLTFLSYLIVIFVVYSVEQLVKILNDILHWHQCRLFYSVIIRHRKRFRELTKEEADRFDSMLSELFKPTK